MWRACLLLALLALVLGGCSSRFLYNKLDTLIVWRVQSFVTLTDEQEANLKADLQAHLDHVRINEMPRIANLLEQSVRDLESGSITAAMLNARYVEAMKFYDELMLGIVPPAERFLRSLSEEQIAEYFANFDELNDEMYDEYSGRTPEVREENRNRSALKTAKSFFGRLSDEQEALITGALENMEDASEEWIDYQRLWQQEFRDLIEERPASEEYRARLTDLFVYPRNLHSEEYRTRVDNNRVILNGMLEELFAGLTDRQRNRAVDKINGYVELLRELAEAP
jgi:hypothetical protein